MKQRLVLLLTAAVAVVFAACGSDSVGSTDVESGPVDLSVAITEQDLGQARRVFDAARERWDGVEPFAYTMTIGVQTLSEVQIAFDADGNVLSERVVKGDPAHTVVTSLPRSVEEAFAAVDDMISAFEDGSREVPDEGECGHHLNARFDTELGVPSQYDSLGPCEDGVGIVVSITRSDPPA